MTDAPVAADFLKSLDVQGDFSSQIAFHHHRLVDDFAELLHLIVRQVSAARVGIHARLCADFGSAGSADPIDVGQADLHAFFSG